jgi:uncharacterized protein (DUF4415 family)
MATEVKRRGRPALSDEQRKRYVIRIRIDAPTMEWLQEVADRYGTDLSAMARRLMVRGLSTEDSPKSGDWVEEAIELPD